MISPRNTPAIAHGSPEGKANVLQHFPLRDANNIMRTFIVEGANWRQRIEIDDSAYEKYAELAAEAMTLAIEKINNCEAENLMKEFADELLGVGAVMTAWGEDDGVEKEKIMVLTEEIFSNAGCHKESEAMQKMREQEN